MVNFDLLCVMATCSSKDIVHDQIESLFWGLNSNVRLIIVNDGPNDLDCFSQNNIFVMKTKGTIHNASKVGFKINEGLDWALNQNFKFKCAMILDDDALVIRKGLDDWCLDKFEKNKNLGLLGVGDDDIANQRYSDNSKLKIYNEFAERWLGNSYVIIPKKFMFYAVNFQSYEMIKCFRDKNLLSSDKEVWPYPCETFQTIFSHNLNFEINFHGQYPKNLLPPLYVTHHGSARPEDPRKLSKNFLIHHSIRQIENVSELEIRKYYRKIRKNKLL
jgi:hypothetical protein